MVKARKFVLTRRFEGAVKPDNFKIVEEDLPDLQDGGCVYLNEHLSSIELYVLVETCK